MSAISSTHRKILLDLLSLPTAPFQEHHVAAYVRTFCERRKLKVKADSFGNLLTCYRRGSRRAARPLAFSAHMDHPGFEVIAQTGPKRVRARWRGGVLLQYFRNAGVRFRQGDHWVRGVVKSVVPAKTGPGRPKRADTVQVELRGRADLPRGTLGMWDLPDAAVRGKRVYARDCDDIAGLAGILCMLETLCRKRTHAEVYCLFTRAEEVGFAGCLSGCRARTLPKKCAVIGIECSSVLPHVRLGDGPVLRVGDRMSVFSPALGEYCRAVADELTRSKKGFRYQRKLMDGGSCESTAYCAHGYEATGICLPLGNYHNMNKDKKRIESEYVHIEDFANMVRWFTALAGCSRPFDPKRADRRERKLESLRKRYEGRLIRTA